MWAVGRGGGEGADGCVRQRDSSQPCRDQGGNKSNNNIICGNTQLGSALFFTFNWRTDVRYLAQQHHLQIILSISVNFFPELQSLEGERVLYVETRADKNAPVMITQVFQE